MATIRRRKTKGGAVRYDVEVRLKGNPPVRRTMRTLAAAREWAKNIEAEVVRGRLLPRIEADKHTLAEAIERYESEALGDLAPTNRRRVKSQLRWWRRELGALTLAALTSAVIADRRARLLRTVSGPTSNRYLAALSVVLQLAVKEWGWLDINPCRAIKRKPESRGRVRFLSEDERDRLLEACEKSSEPRLLSLVLFALTTGARQGELVGLRWEHIDQVNQTATLHDTKNRDRRVVHLHGRAGDALREMATMPHISGYLFAGRSGKPRFPRVAWERALAEAEIEDFRFHDLRHTAASYLAMSGATLPELAAFLGHRTLAMVKRYSHLAEAHSREVSARMVQKFLS